MIGLKTHALGKKLGRKVKGKAIDVMSDVLSAPQRAYYGYKSAKSNNEANILKRAREMKRVPDFDSKGRPSDALKYRTAANAIKDRYNRK